jgi:cobalt-zinc-cadmium efflux system protein
VRQGRAKESRVGLHHHHDHGHGHGHGHHDHGPSSHGRAFAIGVVLNAAFVVVEAVFGFLSGSMALVADAGHNLSDVLGLVIAWGASVLAARPPSARFTYGFKSSSILAALANAALLLMALGAITVESVRRLMAPEPVAGGTVVAVALVGIVINTATALLFAKGRHNDINLRGAFLHMAGDAAVSAGVVIAGLVIERTGALWIDPVTSLVIVAVIAWGTWGLLKDAVKLGLAGVPPGINEGAVRKFLMEQPGVTAVHDLHIWAMSTTETALTAHLVMPGGFPGDGFLHELAHELEHDFGIGHATVQVETSVNANCALESDRVV